MLRLAALIGLIATPALAEVAEISNCRAGAQNVTSSFYCDIENLSDTSIAEVRFYFQVFEDGRAVPWLSGGTEQRPMQASIAGGIEPGETRNVFLFADFVSKEANRSALRIEITPVRFLDVNGSEISSR